ncbi:hypothetical protein [Oceanicaulis sp. MMSF_3324]|uniref:hypothetical protein n=1 Tax=Oceanicaulis sp. MMSF_3324 TaxID=3046702 RepID=UPI00273E354B|nr:hypothetical protein [Oceanicaulis sp. MMSF_3324]
MIANIIVLVSGLALAGLDASEDAAPQYPLGHGYTIEIDNWLDCVLRFEDETGPDDILMGSMECSGARDSMNNISGSALLTLTEYSVQFDVESAVRPVYFEDIYCNAWPEMMVGEVRSDVCWVDANSYSVRRTQ